MKNLKKVVFSNESELEFVHKGMWVKIKVDKDKSLMTFSTPVFSDSEYLPQGVRSCVNKSENAKKPLYPSYLCFGEAGNSVWFEQLVPLSSKAPVLQLVKSFSGIGKFWGRLLKKLADQDLSYL